MDKIDLDAIIEAYIGKSGVHLRTTTLGGQRLMLRDIASEAIHQALILFNNKLSDKIKSLTKPDSFAGWTKDQVNDYMTAAHTIRIYGGQIILDVEKLIV